jgi:hypothetical protein
MKIVKDAVRESFDMYKQFRYKSVPKSKTEEDQMSTETLSESLGNMTMRVYTRRKKYKTSRRKAKPYRSSVRKSKYKTKKNRK